MHDAAAWPRLRRASLALLTLTLLAALVVACGGGVGSGGTGAPQSRSTVTGTVTGFGSVLLDGVRYDNSDAAVVTETSPGVFVNAPLALGHSVEVEIGGEGVASSMAVEARLVAPVDSIGAGGRFTALGQTVQINTDADAGPVTLFVAPLTGVGSLVVGTVVEVHGVTRTISGSDVLQATRIERRAAAPEQWRVAGRVSSLRSAGATSLFSIGALSVDRSGAALQPAGATLADGQTVLVFGTRAPGDPSRLVASQVRVYERLSAPALDAQVGGSVDGLSGAAFSVNGVRVEVGAAQVTPAGRALADGAYVQVRGAYRAGDGVLVASSIQIRNRADAPETELAGSATQVNAAAATARVRGTLVSTAGARLQGCPGGIAEGDYVELTGSLSATGVVAETIRCRGEPGDVTVERSGVAGAVDTQRSTFVLSVGATAVNVRFNKQTFFDGVSAETLEGARVRVEGRFTGAGVLMAQSIVAQ